MVKPGYKQTEVGVIPEDWDCAKFGEKVKIYRGGSPRPIQNYITHLSTGINWIKIGDVGENDKYIRSTQEKIIPEGVSKSREVHVGDFILSNSMSFGRPYILDIDGCIHDGWLTIQEYKNTFHTEYLYYLLSSNLVYQQYISMAAGSSVKNLNKDKVSALNVIYPTLLEQERIAEALSDVDSMISSLEKLIAKKKAVKQGAMQELLSGKKRLPGFTGEWKCEANIFSFSKGTQINSSLLNETDIYPVYNGGREPSGFTDKFNCSRSIIISEGGNSCGFVNMVRQNFWAGGHCYYVYETALDYEFLYHLLKFNENEIMGLRVGSGLPNIQKDALSKLEFTYPLDMLEQTAIASIISDMDNEIEALEQKLVKTRQIKQGMMQQLLTGKIRLV